MLKIEATPTTPEIVFDPSEKCLKIRGISRPEDAFVFYQKIYKYFSESRKLLKDGLRCEIFFRKVICAKSLKMLIVLLKDLKENLNKGSQMEVEWDFDEDDYEIANVGQVFSEILGMPFVMNVLK